MTSAQGPAPLPASGPTAAAGSAPRTSPDRPLPAAAEAPRVQAAKKAESTEKPPEPRGAVITTLRGDLKMVIAGDGGIKLQVIFREYPKSRRQKPLTRSEARRVQPVVPVVAKTQQDTREAVIETAREGIYLFIAEPEQGETAKARFTLKIFEAAPREKQAQIGTRTISGKTVLARVLMPEGILWDDDSAFTGTIEDSQSITKFNAQTGLNWKEYLVEDLGR